MNPCKTTIVSALFFGSMLLAATAQAAIMSVDSAKHGMGSLTRDTDQRLDFLDLTLSTGQSYNDVITQFGMGGNFEGFRHADESEVIALVNNFGFSPGAQVGQVVTGNTGGDQLSGLVLLLGATLVIPDPNPFPTIPLPPGRLANGITRTEVINGSITQLRAPTIFDNADKDANDRVFSGELYQFSPLASGSAYGHWLVRDHGPAPVPTPSAFLLMSTGLLGLIGYRKWSSKTN